MSENFIVILICPTWMPCSLCQFAGRALVEPALSLLRLVRCLVAALWLVGVVPSVNIFAELHLNLINWHLKLTFLWSFNRIQLRHFHIYLWEMKINVFHFPSANFVKYNIFCLFSFTQCLISKLSIAWNDFQTWEADLSKCQNLANV